MAITFRGQASKLKKSAASGNRNGFQEVSASGPRRGAGGIENSSAKKNCSPITQKSRSPLKINTALVAGAANTNKEFIDAGAIVSGALNKPDKQAEGKTADLKTDKNPPDKKTPEGKAERLKVESIDAPKAKGADTDMGATNPMDNMEAPAIEMGI